MTALRRYLFGWRRLGLRAALLVALAGCSPGVSVAPGRSFKNAIGMEMIALSTGYYVSRFETTQGQYQLVIGANPMDPACLECAVGNITGDEALAFCERLTEREAQRGTLPPGYAYRLPTYAQYLEYVADAPLKGSVTPVGGRGGAHLRGPLPVGSGEVNRLGIYDLRGNVSEYLCEPYNTGSLTIVGAHWNTHRQDFLTVRNRAGLIKKDEKGPNIGFRCVLVPQR